MPYVEYSIRRLALDDILRIKQGQLERSINQVNTVINEVDQLNIPDRQLVSTKKVSQSVQTLDPQNETSFVDIMKSDSDDPCPNMSISKRKPPKPLKLTEVEPLNRTKKRPIDHELQLQIGGFIEEQTISNTRLNEMEFLDRHDSLKPSTSDDVNVPCVRFDMTQVNRAVQMKHQYAENLEGPLARTTLHLLKLVQEQTPWYLKPKRDALKANDSPSSASDLLQIKSSFKAGLPKIVHPVIEERLSNLESFLIDPSLVAHPNNINTLPPLPIDIYGRLQRLEFILLAIETKFPQLADLILHYK